MASPMLDRLGARLFAATPGTLAAGERDGSRARGSGCARTVDLRDARTVEVPASGGLRGLVVHVCDRVALPADAAIAVDVPGASVPARMPLTEVIEPGELAITVPAEDLTGPGEAAVRLALTGADGGALPLAAAADGAIVADAVRPADDGLRLSYVDDLVVYERTRALPRIRWAGEGEVVTDPGRRLDLLARGAVPDDVVVLSDDGPAGSGAPAAVDVVRDAPTSIGVDVDAQGDGYLVVADSLQHGWVATVDGEPADLVRADHAGVAVRVPEGEHTVVVSYRPPGQRAGIAVSIVATLALAGVWLSGVRARPGARARAPDRA